MPFGVGYQVAFDEYFADGRVGFQLPPVDANRERVANIRVASPIPVLVAVAIVRDHVAGNHDRAIVVGRFGRLIVGGLRRMAGRGSRFQNDAPQVAAIDQVIGNDRMAAAVQDLDANVRTIDGVAGANEAIGVHVDSLRAVLNIVARDASETGLLV